MATSVRGQAALLWLHVRQEIMKRIQVSKVAVLEDGCLGIFPAASSSMYQYVYREAAGVSWNSVLCCFQSTVPREWDYKKWYGQIVSVVLSSFDTRLSLSPKTVFVPDDPTFITDMRGADAETQNWIDVERPKIMQGEQQRGELQSERRGRLPL